VRHNAKTTYGSATSVALMSLARAIYTFFSHFK